MMRVLTYLNKGMTIDRERRKNRVLEAVVKAHIDSALPVSSSYVARNLNLSSATIRSVMSALEEEGFIRQPYISAGRIPTDLGYRRYVDNVMFATEVAENDILSRVRRFINRSKFFEDAIEATSQAISKITNYTGIAVSPNNRLYFDGTYHMLEQPEFRESETARDFLRVIEGRGEFVRVLNRDLETTGTAIRIGRENAFEELHECTIITSAYKFKNRVSGNIGVIGPMRMPYEEVVPLVEYLARATTITLEEFA